MDFKVKVVKEGNSRILHYHNCASIMLRGSYNEKARKVISALEDQAHCYAQVKEPVWKLLNYCKNNKDKVMFKEADSYKNAIAIESDRNYYHVVLGNKELELRLFNNYYEKQMIDTFFCWLFLDQKENRKECTRKELSSYIDELNEMSKDDYRPE